MEAVQVSTDWWTDKEDVVYKYNGLFSHKKEWNLAIAMTRMELENIMLSEISQRKTNTNWFHSYVEFKKQNKLAKEKQETHTHTLSLQEIDS